MNVTDYKNWVHYCIQANVSAITLSKAGIGKTSIMKQVAKELKRPLVIIEGAYIGDETQLQGIPFNVNNKTTWLPPAQLEVPDNAIIFIDDITLCNAQHLLYPLILDKRIDTRKFPDTVNICAAGNREDDNGARYAFSPVVGNRAAVCLEYHITAAEWIDWAMDNNISPMIIAGIRYYPEWLHKWDDDIRNPTPRSWEIASKLIKVGMSPINALKSTVGDKAAAAMEIVISRANEMVSLVDIVEGTAVVPDDQIATYISISSLGAALGGTNKIVEITNAIEFVDKCISKHGSSLSGVAVKAFSKVRGIHLVPNYIRFVKQYNNSF